MVDKRKGARKTAKEHAADANRKAAIRETLAAVEKGLDLLPPLGNPPVPQDVPPVLYAFPAQVIGTLLPREEDIPEKFRDYHHCPWNELAARWFFSSSGMGDRLPADVELYAKDGVDPEKAYRHVEACMQSRQPDHGHKMRGVCWLIDCFFEKISIPSEKKEYTG